MASTLSKTGITTGNSVEAWHVTQSIDAFNGTEAYDITLSGSFNITGSINGEPGVINPLTASYAISASYAPFPSVGYIEYRATLTQTSTNPPVATVLNSSSLFSSANFIYEDIGIFRFSSSFSFPDVTKVEISIDNVQVLAYPMTNNVFNVISAAYHDTNEIQIRTGKVTYGVISGSGALGAGVSNLAASDLRSDDILSNTRFVIKVWS